MFWVRVGTTLASPLRSIKKKKTTKKPSPLSFLLIFAESFECLPSRAEFRAESTSRQRSSREDRVLCQQAERELGAFSRQIQLHMHYIICNGRGDSNFAVNLNFTTF